MERLETYTLGKFPLPMLSDGGGFFPDSQVGIYKPQVIPKGRITAGFFGSAYETYFPQNIEQYRYTTQRLVELGKETARQGIISVTGAAPGIPHQAAYGASQAGGLVVGFSPRGNEALHDQNFRITVSRLYTADPSLVNPWDLNPLQPYNMVVYWNIGHRRLERTYLQRDLANAFAARITYVADGDAGSAHELFAGVELGNRVFGVLANSGGIAERLQDFVRHVRKMKNSVLVLDEDPIELARKAFPYAQEFHEKRRGMDDTFDYILMQAELSILGRPFSGNNHAELQRELEALQV